MPFVKITERAVWLWLLLASTFASAEIRYLDIWEYRVDGNTLLSQTVVAKTLEPFLGVARKVSDTYAAAEALQQAYRAAGYPTVYVEVPDQDVTAGVVKLAVTQAAVRRVSVTGSRYFTLSGIRETVPVLKRGQVLHVPTLQEELQRANQVNRDLKVVPIVTQGPTEKSIDVELSVADSPPLHGGVSVSNYNSEGTTPTRLSAELSYGNLWQANHELGLQAQISPENEKEVRVFSANYSLPLDNEGDKLALYTVLSDSEIATVGDVNVIGKGTIIGLRYINPFVQTARAVHSISLGVDYKDFKENLELLDGTTERRPITYSSWSALYNLFNRGEKVITEFNAGLTFGIRGLENSDDEFDTKRSLGVPNFALLDLGLKQTWQLPGDWKFRYRLRGQLSDSPLVSNEQYSAGGVGSVRGYYEAQVQGDYGAIGNIELETPDFGRSWTGFDSFTMQWFYDAARLRLENAAADQEDDFQIESTGLTLHARALKHLNLDVSGGYILKEAGELDRGSVRTRARMSVEF